MAGGIKHLFQVHHWLMKELPNQLVKAPPRA